ncbi:hypothetical protein B0H10DRAFT_2226137 [Mycena sp. CBHHK59/15]|nr:hypothetical protein B0H10DRAFT_2226137 [Mycena sp. CBHHK59/15]
MSKKGNLFLSPNHCRSSSALHSSLARALKRRLPHLQGRRRRRRWASWGKHKAVRPPAPRPEKKKSAPGASADCSMDVDPPTNSQLPRDENRAPTSVHDKCIIPCRGCTERFTVVGDCAAISVWRRCRLLPPRPSTSSYSKRGPITRESTRSDVACLGDVDPGCCRPTGASRDDLRARPELCRGSTKPARSLRGGRLTQRRPLAAVAQAGRRRMLRLRDVDNALDPAHKARGPASASEGARRGLRGTLRCHVPRPAHFPRHLRPLPPQGPTPSPPNPPTRTLVAQARLPRASTLGVPPCFFHPKYIEERASEDGRTCRRGNTPTGNPPRPSEPLHLPPLHPSVAPPVRAANSARLPDLNAHSRPEIISDLWAPWSANRTPAESPRSARRPSLHPLPACPQSTGKLRPS